jgi:acyl-CoA synthetase (AMP-forming)/AMP-acid ligase II
VARPLTLLSPEEYIKNPQLWPILMYKTKSCISVAPNFAFGLCAQKFKAQTLALDLSNWKIALCGSETVHPQTLEQFINCFSPYQFDAKALTPVYGLAEATLAVSFAPLTEVLKLHSISLGKAVKHTQIFIEKPNQEGLGEVMVLSPSTSSYPLPLPTGDLGRLDGEGNLFLHGRIKDTIIIRGKNHDPALIENCALLICEKQNFPIRKGQALAFGILNESQGTEEIVLLLEAYQKFQMHQIQEIKKLLIEELALPVFEVQILPSGTLPKTSSGKFKRGEAKTSYMDNSFNIPSKYIYWVLLKEWTKGKINILKGNFT